MPLTSEKNKVLHCLRCGGKDDEIRKYGWLWCTKCYDTVELMTDRREVKL
jgi:protein-arginine kinase activator protein McsA